MSVCDWIWFGALCTTSAHNYLALLLLWGAALLSACCSHRHTVSLGLMEAKRGRVRIWSLGVCLTRVLLYLPFGVIFLHLGFLHQIPRVLASTILLVCDVFICYLWDNHPRVWFCSLWSPLSLKQVVVVSRRSGKECLTEIQSKNYGSRMCINPLIYLQALLSTWYSFLMCKMREIWYFSHSIA